MKPDRKGVPFAFALALLPLVSATGASAQTAAESPRAVDAQAPTPTAGMAEPDDAGAYDLDLTVAGRLRDVTGSREKFQEYREVNDGLLVESLRLQRHRPGSPHVIDLELRNPGLDDESYRLTTRGYGRYRFSLAYDAIPHRFSGGRSLFGGFGTGRLRIPRVVQEQLQANEALAADRGGPPPAGNPTVPNALDSAQQQIVSGLYSAADPVSFGIERRRIGSALELDLSRDARVWVRVQNENRDGARVLGTGSYERWQNGAGAAHTIDRFVTLGAELAEPLDYRTFGASAGAGLQRESWLADVEYTFTSFRNFEDVVMWDNPFRFSDATQVGGVERSRFARSQLVLPPNSLSHDVTASGAVDLPMHGRLAASVSYGMITQDDDFFPYTLNGAITATDFDNNPVGSATDPALLPARDLGGDVRTGAGTVSASVRPLDPMTLSAKYRVLRYDGKSDEIRFPGYAAFGESAWRREKNDVTGGLDGPVANEVFDYWRHEADLTLDYRLTRMLSLSLEGGWEAWRFDHLRVDKLDEYSVGAGFAVRPRRNASLSARYRFSDRTNEGYLRGNTPENPEARGLVNFNWADRRRHLVDARVRYAPHPMVSFGVLGRFVDDEYGGETEGGTVVDQFRFGRTDVRTIGGSVDVSVTPAERLSVQASYSRDYRKEEMANVAKDDAPKSAGFFTNPDGSALADNYSPVNYWNSDITDTVDTLGAGATVDLIPDRLVLDARYNLSFSDVEVDTVNPNPIDTGATTPTLANAVANAWPTIQSRLHEVVLDLGFRLTPNVRTGVRYLFASYDLDDFAWDIMNPYMADRSAENSTRFVFADATYNAYEAHVGTVYVAGSF